LARLARLSANDYDRAKRRLFSLARISTARRPSPEFERRRV